VLKNANIENENKELLLSIEWAESEKQTLQQTIHKLENRLYTHTDINANEGESRMIYNVKNKYERKISQLKNENNNLIVKIESLDIKYVEKFQSQENIL
jgi:hypothetical protein